MIAIDFVHAGPLAEGQAKLAEAYGHLTPDTRTDNMYTWDTLNTLSTRGLVAPFCARGERKDSYSVSIKKYYDIPAMRDLWETYVWYHSRNPDFGKSAILLESYPVQAVQNVDPAIAGAYPNRDVSHILYPPPLPK